MDIVELERLKFAARMITLGIAVFLDVIWICYSQDDDWESIPSFMCACINIGLFVFGILWLGVWGWT